MLRLKRIVQNTASHCGPATLAMLLAREKCPCTQENIVLAARASKTIKKYGVSPDQLEQAAATLCPQLTFWFKEKTNINDLDDLIHSYHQAVGINWQNLFYDSYAEEKRLDPRGDHGHYSVVIGIDRQKNIISLVDPYFTFKENVRHFSYRWFLKRWWDKAKTPLKNPKTGYNYQVYTKRLSFILTPKNATFPKRLHYQPASNLSQLYRTQL